MKKARNLITHIAGLRFFAFYIIGIPVYAPFIRRFISEGTAFDGENWYVHCYNDPVLFIMLIMNV